MNTQIDELALNLRMYDKQRLQDIEKNRCNHEIVIKQLETMLRGRCYPHTTYTNIAREKEYLSLLHLQQAQNANKEKEVQTLYTKLKALRAKIEHAKERSKQVQYTNVGYDKFNELESKLKES